jgi:hypothetical protein
MPPASNNNFMDINTFDKTQLHVFPRVIGTREKICITYGSTMRSLSFVTPTAITNYPRLTGDGDFGTTFGPTDIKKARFSLDVNNWETESAPTHQHTEDMEKFLAILADVDEALLNFMYGNQLKWLQRKNLSREEVRMLQIPSVKIPINKESGAEKPKTVKLQTGKFYFDQVGNERERTINVCDFTGRIVAEGAVMPGDAVCCSMHLGSVYNGVGGDKFGISWQLEDVQVVCQSEHMKPKEYVVAFANKTDADQLTHDYTFSGNTEFGASY